MKLFLSTLLLSAFAWGSLYGIGMRADVGEQAYLKAGRNEAPYQAGKAFPAMDSVCAIIKVYPKRKKSKSEEYEPIGTGSLIANRFVLTAAHVIITEKGDGLYEKGLRVHFGPDLDEPTKTVVVSKVHTVFPEGSKLLKALGVKGNFSDKVVYRAEFADLAILELATPVNDIAPAPIAMKSPERQARTVVAGFGDAGFGNNFKQRKWKQSRYRRAAENVIDRQVTVNPESGSITDGGLIMMDFDNGDAGRNTLNGGDVSGWEDLIKAGSSSQKPLPLEGIGYPGDSGGPAFIYQDGQWKVFGVCGYGTGYPAHKKRERIQYGDISVYTRVLSRIDWLKGVTGK